MEVGNGGRRRLVAEFSSGDWWRSVAEVGGGR